MGACGSIASQFNLHKRAGLKVYIIFRAEMTIKDSTVVRESTRLTWLHMHFPYAKFV